MSHPTNRPNQKSLFPRAFAAAALLALACVGTGYADGKEKPMTQAEATKEVTTESGLKYTDVKMGDGTQAKAGDTVEVHYTGTLENGKKFDSSRDRGTPLVFRVGVGQVIKGWDEGIAGMKVGGQRKLVIPPDLGYGANGAGGVIPPNAILIFDVELVGIKP